MFTDLFFTVSKCCYILLVNFAFQILYFQFQNFKFLYSFHYFIVIHYLFHHYFYISLNSIIAVISESFFYWLNFLLVRVTFSWFFIYLVFFLLYAEHYGYYIVNSLDFVVFIYSIFFWQAVNLLSHQLDHFESFKTLWGDV